MMSDVLNYPPPTNLTYYLSGPISGDIKGNEAKFHEAVVELRARGYDIVSPVEVCTGHIEDFDLERTALDWIWYMRRDIEALVNDKVQGIIMLPGWEGSRGARLELLIAKGLNMRAVSYASCLTRQPVGEL
jgi:hypothetical protein